METPTARQTQVLQCIERVRLKHFRGPSLREVQRALRLPEGNVQAATDHLRALEKKGFAVHVPREAYSARLTPKGEAWVRRVSRVTP